jgi:hypothetical protein
VAERFPQRSRICRPDEQAVEFADALRRRGAVRGADDVRAQLGDAHEPVLDLVDGSSTASGWAASCSRCVSQGNDARRSSSVSDLCSASFA